MRKKLFAACITAQRATPRGPEAGGLPMAYAALDESSAVNMGMADAIQKWPPQHGWQQHGCGVVEIPEGFVRRLYP